jgi:hypothetical protein
MAWTAINWRPARSSFFCSENLPGAEPYDDYGPTLRAPRQVEVCKGPSAFAGVGFGKGQSPFLIHSLPPTFARTRPFQQALSLLPTHAQDL